MSSSNFLSTNLVLILANIQTMSLGLDLIEGTATGQMHGYWNNPFGISDAIKIGPDLILGVDIIFAQFVTTGCVPRKYSFPNMTVLTHS
jgi:hypothetical protein